MTKLIVFLMLFCSASAFAKQKRSLANKQNKEVYTFACHAEDSIEPIVIAALASSSSADDNNAGSGSASVFIRQNKDMNTLILRGLFTRVPDGFVFVALDNKSNTKYSFNVHPNDNTKLPGLPPLICEITGQLKMNGN